jgi:SAM-dependent methyltransferase
MTELPRDHQSRIIDFGRTAEDYDRHRPGFPDSFFIGLEAKGWIAPNQRALDLGTGTGAMALGLAARGLHVAALDRSKELLLVLERRAKERSLQVRIIEGVAEDTCEAAASYDLICAAQAWWWFDPKRTLAEAHRLLVPGGRVLIASFCYLPLAGSIAEASEALVLKHNPGWGAAGCLGIFPEQPKQLAEGGYRSIETFSYDVEVPFSHEAWRGRMRACNGVAASLAQAEVASFDRDLAALLASRCTDPFTVLHRVFVVMGLR